MNLEENVQVGGAVAEQEWEAVDTARRAIYADRNRLVELVGFLAQASGLPVQWGEDAEAPGWRVLYIQLPTGQVSWHLPADAWHIGASWGGRWDGHDNAEKARRILSYVGAGDTRDEGVR
jgi:hypothetical protein